MEKARSQRPTVSAAAPAASPCGLTAYHPLSSCRDVSLSVRYTDSCTGPGVPELHRSERVSLFLTTAPSLICSVSLQAFLRQGRFYFLGAGAQLLHVRLPVGPVSEPIVS